MKHILFLCTLFISAELMSGPKKKQDQPEVKIEKTATDSTTSAPQAIPQSHTIPVWPVTPYPSPNRTICVIGTALPASDDQPSLEKLLAKDFHEVPTDDCDGDDQSENCDWEDQIEYMFEHPEERE